jgi:CAAX protease family protein
MSGQDPLPESSWPPDAPGLPEPAAPPEPPSPPAPAPDAYPFWNYHDLFVFCGAAVTMYILLGLGVSAAVQLLHLQVRSKILVLLPGQLAMYAFVFVFLALLFRLQYGRPFWASLRWTRTSQGVFPALPAGVLAAFAIAYLGVALRTPDLNSPMRSLLSDPHALVLVGILGVSVGPLVEEIVFRGFMQPLFVRSLGATAGILLAGVLFGLLHLPEYGDSWRHGLLITAAGASFGWMRHRSGSTLAATLMHAAYNSTFFVALILQRKELLH